MKTKNQWASKLGFIMATAGAAVGLKSLWKFPYLMGRNGGAPFLVAYLFFIYILGVPVMMLEMSLDRGARHDPVQAYGDIHSNARTTGVFRVAAVFLILSYYNVIGSWIIKYIVNYGTTFHTPEGFEAFISASAEPVFWHSLFLFMTTAVCYHGISGTENVSRITMPLLFVLLIVAIVRNVTLPGVVLGLRFTFIPNSAAFDMKAVSAALGQVFCSPSLYVGITITYGSYLGDRENIPRSRANVVGLDTIIAMMADIAIFPAVFSFGLEPGQRPGLTLSALPKMFASIKGGSVFTILFFALVLFAAMTSAIALLEMVVSLAVDSLKWVRKKTAVILGLLIFLTRVPSALPFGILGNMTTLNYSVFNFVGMVTDNILLPFGDLAMCYFIGWKWSPRYLVDEMEKNGVAFRLKKLWIFCIHFLTPILMTAVTLTGFASICSIVRGWEYTYGQRGYTHIGNQKRENLLGLAPDVMRKERLKSINLNVGYDPKEKIWELIARHNGSLKSLRDEGIRVSGLAAGCAVLVVSESRIEQVNAIEQIAYIEKPKELFFASNMARATSCLNTIQTNSGAEARGTGIGGVRADVISSLESGLTGKSVLMTVIDPGIGYFHPDFRNPDGTIRIGLPANQDRGRIYTREKINAALETGSRASALVLVPSASPSGHGTVVATIAAGNGKEGNGVYHGVAYESELMVVRLGTPLMDSFPRATQLMKTLDLVVRRTQDMNRPLTVGISLGDTYGSHDGTSLLETFINDMSGIGRNVIVAGTGNEGTGTGHRTGSLVMGQEENAQLSIAPYETGIGVQLWRPYMDQFFTRLVTPSGEITGPADNQLGPQTLRYGGAQILIYYGKPSPFSRAQEVCFNFLPVRNYLSSGIWTFRLTPERIVTDRYDMWLPFRGILNPSARFLRPIPETILTIPSTAANVISVGAYNDSYRAYADSSGHSFIRQTGQVKPDLAAPGVNIVTARRGSGYEAVTGTSFAAPFVTDSAALLMQWGILQRNNPFLYGEKVEAYFTGGVRYLPGYDVQPNERLGYGTLCVGDSLPLGNSQNL